MTKELDKEEFKSLSEFIWTIIQNPKDPRLVELEGSAYNCLTEEEIRKMELFANSLIEEQKQWHYSNITKRS
jgi:hypothetical protein